MTTIDLLLIVIGLPFLIVNVFIVRLLIRLRKTAIEAEKTIIVFRKSIEDTAVGSESGAIEKGRRQIN